MFGQKYNNNRLLADLYAEQGYFVLIPDLFHKDPVVNFVLEELPGWIAKHPAEGVQAIIRKIIPYILKEHNPSYFVAVGYCWGAKYAIQLVGKDAEKHFGAQLDSIAIFHPSLVTEEEVKDIVKPVFIGAAETDQVFTNELRKRTEEILAENKAKYFMTLTSGVAHGFAARADKNDPYQKWALEKVFRDGLEYLEYINASSR